VTRTYKRDEFEVRALDDVTLDIPAIVRGDHGTIWFRQDDTTEFGYRD